MARPNERPTADQLRARMDRGAAKDKLRAIDPAAAPLATDEEAAGNRPTMEQFAAVAHAELMRPAQPPDRASTVVIVLAVLLTAFAGLAAIFLSAP